MSSRYTLRVDRQGRVVLPAPARRELGVDGGGALTLEIGEHDARLSSTRMALRRIQQPIRQYVPVGVSLVDDRIGERRAEPAREDAAGRLRPATRRAGPSFGDLACLALAVSRGAVVLTADRRMAEPALGLDVRVIR